MDRLFDRDLGLFFFCGLWDLFSLPEVFLSCLIEDDLLTPLTPKKKFLRHLPHIFIFNEFLCSMLLDQIFATLISFKKFNKEIYFFCTELFSETSKKH